MTSDLRALLQQALGSGYTIDRELGGGGMSRVFVARDITLRRDVVVKVLPPELVAGVSVERFRREILVAAGLQHPHIVPVHASGDVDGVPWFTMPFVQGESLRERLQRGPMPIAEVTGILREIAKALAYAHERGVVHRDVKPDNVLLTGGTAVVTDFGIAKALSASRTMDSTETSASLTQMGMSIGTPTYMAPEQAAADPSTDARADIYAFGCVAYEMLAGRPPFAGMSPQKLLAAHMAEQPQPIGELRSDTPPVLAELVMQCLEKEPERRPARADDLIRRLDAATTGDRDATSAALAAARVKLPVALGIWVGVMIAAWLLSKAAVIAVGLPGWVVPGALILAALGLPAILITTYAHLDWKRTMRAGWIAFGAFAVGVALFMTSRVLGIGPAASLLAAGRLNAKQPLLVTDFTVKKGDSTLAGVVSEAIRASLSQSTAITLLPPTAVAGALERMQRPTTSRLDLTLARDVARREGVSAIVDGDITELGSGYIVTVRLVSVDSAATLASVQKSVDGPKELVAGIDEIGRTLRGRIGESLRSVQRAPALAQVTTSSVEALRLYSQARRTYAIDGDLPLAIERLRQAVAIDSSFAGAWSLLGAVYIAARFPTSAIDSMIERAYHFRQHLTVREQQGAESFYFYRGPGRDRARGAAITERLLATGDSSPGMMTSMAILLTSRRQLARAESLDRAAARKEPSALGYANMATHLMNEGRLETAQRTIDTALTLFPSPAAQEHTLSEQVALDAAQNHFDAAVHLSDSLLAHAPRGTRAGIASAASMLALVRGRIGEFRARLGVAQTSATATGFTRISTADSINLSIVDATTIDQPTRAVQRLDATLAAMPFNTRPDIDRNYLGVATVYARAGRPDKAKGVLAQRTTEMRDTALIRSQIPLVHRVLGEIAVAEHRPLDAVREFWMGDSLPDGPVDACDACTYVSVARAYDKANLPDSAITYFEKHFASPYALRMTVNTFATRGPALRRLGELYEAKGNAAKAAHYYQMFVDLWKTADPELQPQVVEIRRRLARLTDTERK